MLRAAFVALILIFIAGTSFLIIKHALSKPAVEMTKESSKTRNTDSTVSETKSPSTTPKPILLSKKTYKIALYGDSMIDTMAEHIKSLDNALTDKYPGTTFTIYNYGIGGENVEKGLARVESPFNNRGRAYPPLPSIQADVIIVGSFAYNPFSPHDRDKHYTILNELVQKTRNFSPQVYLLAEIAPLGEDFGRGPNGVNWSDDTAREHALRIIEQLENVVNLSKAGGFTLIDAFHPSQIEPPFGNPTFVTESDGIHPSALGHAFMANIIVETLKLK